MLLHQCILFLHGPLLDEGEWASNLHDSHYDRELSTKAATLPASKVSDRLWLELAFLFPLLKSFILSYPMLSRLKPDLSCGSSVNVYPHLPLHHQRLVSPLWMQSVIRPSANPSWCHPSITWMMSFLVPAHFMSLFTVCCCWKCPEVSMAFGAILHHSYDRHAPLTVIIQHCSSLGDTLEILTLFGCLGSFFQMFCGPAYS